MRIVPRTLTTRLVVTAVALVALVSVLVALVTTLAMSQYLTSRLDAQLTQAVQRADRPSPGGDVPGGPGRGFGGAFAPDTLLVDYSGLSSSGILGEDRTLTTISSANLSRLSHVPADKESHTVDLQGLGDYRVQVASDATGNKVAIGLPMDEIHRTTHSLLLWSSLLALCGVLLAALLGILLVRRQLRPLREVAATAYDVTALPLDAGGQTIGTRVPAELTDPRNEVGQVGGALNTLLDHVDAALDARHRSEQQVRRFVADASHELRTPLSTIHGYAELSRRTPDDADALLLALDKVSTLR